MLKYQTGQPSKEEKRKIVSILSDIIDLYGDFYITKNNLRLMLRENTHLLFECLGKNDKIVYGEEGIAFITGWSDNSNRKYIKILAKDTSDAEKILEIVNWNLNETLYAKIKKENPILSALQRKGFKFAGDRGKEILLCRKDRLTKSVNLSNKDEEGDN